MLKLKLFIYIYMYTIKTFKLKEKLIIQELFVDWFSSYNYI